MSIPTPPATPPGPTPHTTSPVRTPPRTQLSTPPPRFVTHIDDAAIASLRAYYAQVLPPVVSQTGPSPRILDLCSSWTSHFPSRIYDAVGKGEVEVWGLGMNARELERNPVFRDGGGWGVWDLNREGKGDVGVAVKATILKTVRGSGGEVEVGSPSPSTQPQHQEAGKEQGDTPPLLDATTCVVSTDYLTQPLSVFSSLLRLTKPGGSVHLTISNRCFPTKAIARWLRVDEEERLQMVGDYLFFAGWKRIEIVELSDGRVRGSDGDGSGEGEGEQGGLGAFMRALGMDAGRRDPLWVVRGVKE
ncbi:hypothetical protein D0863_16211 [Hortaea werneckii]|uniref:Methyltransferase type 11 domain-containing protein n=1 Tax=Hortaea werneckii TaxID=91943 RepID=A0A3M7BY99_HORWE|nr:hypothetical protein D0863_16211 [Hortaea werneckii]